MRFTLFADGGSRGNPGKAGAGALVKDEQGELIVRVSEFLGHTTNNVAEYTAVLSALEGLSSVLGSAAKDAQVAVFMDSKLVIEQMNGNYKIKHPNLILLAARVKNLVPLFGTVSFAHVPREKNKEADALANEAMDRGA